jgi:hypothetical protein
MLRLFIMPLPYIPKRRWLVQGSLIGSLLLPFFLLLPLTSALLIALAPITVAQILFLYLKIAIISVIPVALVSVAVGWLAEKRWAAGDPDARVVFLGAGSLAIAPSVLLLTFSLKDGIRLDQFINIIFGFGVPPVIVAMTVTAIILKSAARRQRC